MCFHLENLLATVQRVIDIILSIVKVQFALMYLKVRAVLYETTQEYIARTKMVLTLFKNANVPLKLKHCALFTNCIDYAGHVMKLCTLEVGNSTTDDI